MYAIRSYYGSPLAELREHIARGAARNEGAIEEERCITAFFFLDRLLFSSIKTRGGKRGQKGESISTAITRRIRQAWEGECEKLWEDSSSPPPSAQGAKQTPTQILSRDIKSIQEALADEDIRAAFRITSYNVCYTKLLRPRDLQFRR